MAYAADLLTVSTGGIRSVCMLLDELSSTSTISATIEASPPLCIIITNYVTFLKVKIRATLYKIACTKFKSKLAAPNFTFTTNLSLYSD